jgi:DNA-directed RNA polymerase specialized sigma24 family protein
MKNRLLGAASLCLALIAAPAFAQDVCDCPCPECPEARAEHQKEVSPHLAPQLTPEEQAAVLIRKRENTTPSDTAPAVGIAVNAVAAAAKAVGAALSQAMPAPQTANPTPAEPAA